MSRLRQAAVQSVLSLFRLIRSWSTVDRIRIPPSTGRLLRIRSGDCVQIRATHYRVTSRTVTTGSGAGGSGTCVTCQLSGPDGHGVLQVELLTSFRSESRLQTADGTIDLFDDDVVIMAASPVHSGFASD